MGAGESTGVLGLDLTEELSKPIHASDVNTPRGVEARKEVIRIRAMLREAYDKTLLPVILPPPTAAATTTTSMASTASTIDGPTAFANSDKKKKNMHLLAPPTMAPAFGIERFPTMDQLRSLPKPVVVREAVSSNHHSTQTASSSSSLQQQPQGVPVGAAPASTSEERTLRYQLAPLSESAEYMVARPVLPVPLERLPQRRSQHHPPHAR